MLDRMPLMQNQITKKCPKIFMIVDIKFKMNIMFIFYCVEQIVDILIIDNNLTNYCVFKKILSWNILCKTINKQKKLYTWIWIKPLFMSLTILMTEKWVWNNPIEMEYAHKIIKYYKKIQEKKSSSNLLFSWWNVFIIYIRENKKKRSSKNIHLILINKISLPSIKPNFKWKMESFRYLQFLMIEYFYGWDWEWVMFFLNMS